MVSAPVVSAPVTSKPGVSAPAVSKPAKKPVVTVRGSRSAGAVKKGTAVAFSVRTLADGTARAGLPVQLERRTGSGWTVVRRGTSGKAGLLVLRLPQDRTAEYRFRSGAALSGALRVVVR